MKLERVLTKNKGIIAVAILGIVLLLLSLVMNNLLKLILFFGFTLISGVTVYILISIRSPIDMSPVFFLMIIISLTYGFGYSVVFVLIANLIPSIIAGGEVGVETFLFMGSFLVLSFLSRSFVSYGIVPLGVGLTVANLIVGWFINNISGNPGGIIFSVVHAAVTIFYFVAFGGFLMGVLGVVF